MAFMIHRIGTRAGKTSLLSNSIRAAATSAQTVSIEANEAVSWDNARPYEEIPGPKPLPIIGNLHQFIPGIGEMGDPNLAVQFKNLFHKYGKIVKISKLPGRRDMLLLFDPKMFEEMYRNEGPWPVRDAMHSFQYYRMVLRKDYFQGIGGLLVNIGEDWKKFRTKVNPPMMQPRIANMYIKPIIEVTDDFLRRVKSLRNTKSEMPADFLNEINKWALESITMIALDKRIGCLEPKLKPDSEPQRMIDAAETMIHCFEILEMRLPIWKLISTPTWRKCIKALDFFYEVSMKHINDAVQRIKDKKPGVDYEPSVLEKLLIKEPDPKTACIMAMDMMIAGVDTTSVNVANIMYLLSKNQEKQEHLYQEMKRFLPNRNDEITVDMVENMKYLKACMKEAMRLLGIAQMNLRGTVKDTVIGNYRIPKDVNVFMAHMLCGQMDEHLQLPSKFIPERWLKNRPDLPDSIGSAEDYDSVKEQKIHPFVFMPFGFGPRMCIGKRFAELELTIMMIKMIRNFKVEYNYGDIEYQTKFILKPVNPLKFKLTDRKA